MPRYISRPRRADRRHQKQRFSLYDCLVSLLALVKLSNYAVDAKRLDGVGVRTLLLGARRASNNVDKATAMEKAGSAETQTFCSAAVGPTGKTAPERKPKLGQQSTTFCSPLLSRMHRKTAPKRKRESAVDGKRQNNPWHISTKFSECMAGTSWLGVSLTGCKPNA